MSDTATWLTTREIAERMGIDNATSVIPRLNNAYRLGLLIRRRDPAHTNRWLWAPATDARELLASPDPAPALPGGLE